MKPLNPFDSLLKEVLWEVKEKELSRLPTEDEITHTFSEKFRKKMTRLIRSEKRGLSSAAARKFKKVVAVIVAVILALTVTTTADAWIEKLFDFVYRIYESIVTVDYEQDRTITDASGEEIEPVCYMIPYIPDGFEATDIFASAGYVDAFWRNGETDEHISFTQGGIYSAKHNTDELIQEEFELNGVHVLCLRTPNIVHCYWDKDGYHFCLDYSASLGDRFMKKNVGKLIEYRETAQ